MCHYNISQLLNAQASQACHSQRSSDDQTCEPPSRGLSDHPRCRGEHLHPADGVAILHQGGSRHAQDIGHDEKRKWLAVSTKAPEEEGLEDWGWGLTQDKEKHRRNFQKRQCFQWIWWLGDPKGWETLGWQLDQEDEEREFGRKKKEDSGWHFG